MSQVRGLMGITEVALDKFAFVGGNFTINQGTRNSFRVWTVQMEEKTAPREPELVTTIPEAILLNGMTSPSGHVSLVADSILGHVYRVDTRSGNYKIQLAGESMRPIKPNSVGINGIHVYQNRLYWTNSDYGKLYST